MRDEGRAGIHDVNIFTVQARANVVFIHAGDGSDGEFLLRRVANRAAGDAVAAALESRTCDDQFGFEFGHALNQRVEFPLHLGARQNNCRRNKGSRRLRRCHRALVATRGQDRSVRP